MIEGRGRMSRPCRGAAWRGRKISSRDKVNDTQLDADRLNDVREGCLGFYKRIDVSSRVGRRRKWKGVVTASLLMLLPRHVSRITAPAGLDP